MGALDLPASLYSPSKATTSTNASPVCVANYSGDNTFSQVQIALFRQELSELQGKLEAAQERVDALQDEVDQLTDLKSGLSQLQKDLKESLPEVCGVLKAYGELPGVTTGIFEGSGNSILSELSEWDIDIPNLAAGDALPSAEDWYFFVTDDLSSAKAQVGKKLKSAVGDLGNAKSKLTSIQSKIRDTTDVLKSWGVCMD